MQSCATKSPGCKINMGADAESLGKAPPMALPIALQSGPLGLSHVRRLTMRALSPASIPPPFAAYAHGVAVPSGARFVLTSGQLGIGPGGVVPPDARAQADLCFANCAAILAEAGMGPADAVRINAFVTDRAYMAAYMAARDAWLAGVDRRPASTLVIVAGFTRPEFLVEVEVTAAQV
jgi:enamine deaminase RidA (YjgF/YER057c/UK114 family)